MHLMDRIKVPRTKRRQLKGVLQTLRDAFFMLDEDILEKVKRVLREKHEKTEKQIEAMLTFNFKYFAKRVQRSVPPPGVLYPRMKAAFDVFADLIDPKTKKPLFGKKAKEKMRSVLDAGPLFLEGLIG